MPSVVKEVLRFLWRRMARSSWVRRRIDWGYLLVPRPQLFVNFIFQRFLRINAATPWSVNFTSRVHDPRKIVLGRNVGKSFAVSGACYIQAFNGIEIGDNTIFSFGVGIISSDHEIGNLAESTRSPPIRIGRNCWLGKNAIILPGVELGDGCVVAAGAVVTKSFGPGSVVAGVPAELIRQEPAVI